jgi:hypothetical protein
MPGLDTDLLLSAIGLGLIAYGLYVRFGSWKDWYWKTRGGMYGYIPLGLMLLFEANYIQFIPNAPRYISIVVLVLLALVVLYLTIKQPYWIKPNWVRWLENQPKRIQQAMQEDAQLDKNWSRHTNSAEAVELWAKELKKGIKTKN